MVSYFKKSNISEEFIWSNGINTSGSGHGARYINEKIRRVYFIGEATSTSQLDVITDPEIEIGMGAGGYAQIGVPKTTTEPYSDFYFGGVQIEEVDNSYVDGIAWIGDSTIQANAGGNDSYLNTAIPRYVESILNVNCFNRAIGGERLDQIDARWSTDITPLKSNSKYVVIQGGINDIVQGRTLGQMQSSLDSMNVKALADGYEPIFLTITPNSTFDTTENDLRLQYNQWLKDTYNKVIDICQVVEYDNLLIKGVPSSNYEGDGVHYGISLRKSVANYIVKSGYFDFLQPSDYQKTTASYTNKNLTIGNISVKGTILDANNEAGTSGQFLSSLATGIDWVSIDKITVGLSNVTNTAQWNLQGNSGTNPATDFIGTTDAKDFVVKTNNIERARFTGGGSTNLGLGITTPTYGIDNQVDWLGAQYVRNDKVPAPPLELIINAPASVLVA